MEQNHIDSSKVEILLHKAGQAWQTRVVPLLEEALRKLPEQHEMILLLSYYQQISPEEIATLLELPGGTEAVKALQDRALARLADERWAQDLTREKLEMLLKMAGASWRPQVEQPFPEAIRAVAQESLTDVGAFRTATQQRRPDRPSHAQERGQAIGKDFAVRISKVFTDSLRWIRGVVHRPALPDDLAPIFLDLSPDFSLAQLHRTDLRTLFHILPRAFFLMPVLTGVLIFLWLYLLGESAALIEFGVITGVVLSVPGTLLCSLALNIAGSVPGGMAIATGFGVGYTLLVNMGGGIAAMLARAESTDLVAVIAGGIASLVSPTVLVIMGVSVAIGIASYTIANAARHTAVSPSKGLLEASFQGFWMSGVLTGLVLGLTQMLSYIMPTIAAFCLVFGPVGGSVLSIIVRWRTGSHRRGAILGTVYGLVICLMVVVSFNVLEGSVSGLVMGGMTTALFHGTFFALAYTVGERSGGPWAGALASAASGILGYVGFVVIFHHVTPPPLALTPLVWAFVSLAMLSALLAFIGYLFVVSDHGDAGREHYYIDSIHPAIKRWANILPPVSILLCLVAFVVLPAAGVESLFTTTPLWPHTFGFGLLFAFLIISQYLQIEAWFKLWKRRRTVSIAKTYRRLCNVVVLIPAPAAIIILISGLRLVYQGGYSISAGWLFYLVGLFSFMFADGLAGYLPHTRRFMTVSREAIITTRKAEELRKTMKDQIANLVLFLHFASFPFVFILGYYKPDLPNPFANLILWLEGQLGQIEILVNFSKIIPVVLWIGVVSAFVLFLRLKNLGRAHSNLGEQK